jgi:hypothetical protein
MANAARPATAGSSPCALPARGSAARRARPWRAAVALVLPALFAGCYHNDSGTYYPYPLVEVSYGVAAADFNGDGFADVVQLSTVQPIQTPGSSNLKTYLSSGAGVFAAPAPTPAGTDPLYVVAADVNGDGFTDLVTASYDDGTVSVFFSNPASPGAFNPPLVLPSAGASQLAVADLTGDGLPDLVSADYNVSLFVQTSAGAFAAPVNLYPGGANWVAVGDLNGDGAPDVVLTDAVGVKLLVHTGAPSDTTFAAPVSVFTQTANANLAGANLIAIADLDGDGLNDLVITDPGPTGGLAATVNVLRQDPANPGSFLAAVPYPIATRDVPQSIRLTDLQGTGQLDIVIGERDTVTVLLHDPATPGRFLPATIYTVPDANEIAIADVDGDGRPDIVVSNGTTQPFVNGVYTTHPGVLLQSATTSGAFGALQDLP